MSVAQLSARELGAFVACVIKSERFSEFNLDQLCKLAEMVSASNLFAFAATYRGEQFETVSADEVEREALYLLRDNEHITTHFGPLLYNCISNDGQYFWGGQLVDHQHPFFVGLKGVETAASEWQESKQREIKRKEENARAFDQVGQLQEMSQSDIRAMADKHGKARVIIASFHVNESCSYTDYWGCRTAREVVIGFGKGKRESFKQLRASAGTFEPTKHLGPGRDQWTARSVWDHDSTDNEAREASMYDNGGQSYCKGQWSRFKDSPTFETLEGRFLVGID